MISSGGAIKLWPVAPPIGRSELRLSHGQRSWNWFSSLFKDTWAANSESKCKNIITGSLVWPQAHTAPTWVWSYNWNYLFLCSCTCTKIVLTKYSLIKGNEDEGAESGLNTEKYSIVWFRIIAQNISYRWIEICVVMFLRLTAAPLLGLFKATFSVFTSWACWSLNTLLSSNSVGLPHSS